MISVLLAEAPDTLWTRMYGGYYFDRAFSVQQTNDSGFIVAGETRSFGSICEVYLLRLNSNGDTLWTKTYGGSLSDHGKSVQQTNDSGFIVAGYTNSFGTGGVDVYLIRTNSNGDTLWTKTYGDEDEDLGLSVQKLRDGGFIIGGTTVLGPGNKNVYLIRTDSLGDTLWTKTYAKDNYATGNSVCQTKDGGFVIAGETGSSIQAVDRDAYLICTDSTGNMLWSKTYGGSDIDGSYSVQQTTDGGFIIAGYSWSIGQETYDVYLIRTDSNGDTLWTKTFGGSGMDCGYSVQQTSEGGFIIVGSLDSSNTSTFLFVIRTNSVGDTLWTKKYGKITNTAVGYSVQQTSDGGFIIAGLIAVGSNAYDVYLIRLKKETTDIQKNPPNNSKNLITLHNFPNPFSKTTNITYTLKQPAVVTIEIYNLFGKRIRTLINQNKTSGNHSTRWNGMNDRNMPVSKGVYYSVVTIDTGAEKVRQRGRMVLE